MKSDSLKKLKHIPAWIRFHERCPLRSIGLNGENLSVKDYFQTVVEHLDKLENIIDELYIWIPKENNERIIFKKLWEHAPLEVRYGTLKTACYSAAERRNFYFKLARYLGKDPRTFFIENGLNYTDSKKIAKKNYTEYNVYQIKLKKCPSLYQKLNSLFLIPETLNNLLDPVKKDIHNQEQAKLFLLTKFQDILSISSTTEKDYFVSQLNIFLNFWLHSKRIPNRFSFHGECSIKKTGETIYIKNLGHLLVDNPSFLNHLLCFKWKFYKKNFDLVKIKNEYFIEVMYNPIKSKSTTKNVSETTFFGTGFKQNNPLLNIELYTAFLNRVESSFVKTNYSKLQGRQVSGGLPTLGKNR